MDDNAMRLSAALALYAILSLAPLLVISVKVVAFLWHSQHQARDQVMAQLSSLMGQSAANGLAPLFEATSKPSSGVLATIASSAVLLFSATGVFVELQDSMNTIWHVKPPRGSGILNFVRQRILSLAMVFGIAFLLLVSMFISALLTALARGVVGDSRWIFLPVDVVASCAVASMLFAAIFKFLPDVEVRWREVWHAAFLTGSLFTLGKYALAVYFKFAAPTSAFGAAGSLVAVLLWVYYSSFILFFGAEFSKVWAKGHGTHVNEAEQRHVTADR